MRETKIEGQNRKKEEKKEANKDALQRVCEFMTEDDETFFRRTIQGLSLAEIEEFLTECPEFRKFWEEGKFLKEEMQ